MNYYISNGTFYAVPQRSDELYHYGVPGMKWGQRKARVTVGSARSARRSSSAYGNMNSSRAAYKQAKQAYRQAKKAERNSPEAKAERAAKAKRAAKIGAAVAAAALAAYGAHKLNKYVKTKNAQIAAERGFKEAERMFKDQSNRYAKDFISGKVKAYDVTVNAGSIARGEARRASSDSFRTAARNVIDYKRSGNSLKNLRSVSSYGNQQFYDRVNMPKR